MKFIEELCSGLSAVMLIIASSKNPVLVPYYLLIFAIIGCVLSFYHISSAWNVKVKTSLWSILGAGVIGAGAWLLAPWAGYGACALSAYILNILQNRGQTAKE